MKRSRFAALRSMFSLRLLLPLSCMLVSAPALAGPEPSTPFPSSREYYEPLLADPAESSYGGRLIYPPGGARFGEVTIGDYVGLARFKVADRWNAQLNLGGGAISRFNLTTRRNNFEAIDFHAVMPVDIVLNRAHVVRVSYWHTSSHLGDDYIERLRPVARKLAFDAIKATLSWRPEERLRLYAGGGFAWNTVNLDGRAMIQLGAELRSRSFWRPTMRAFLAQDFQSAERVGWNPSYNVRGGVRWSGPNGVAAASVFTEYFTGVPYYLQFKEMRESHWGLGLRLEIGNMIP